MEKKLIEYLNSERYDKPKSVREISVDLDATSSDSFKLLMKTLNHLENTYVIARNSDDKYDFIENMRMLVGKISFKKGRFAFVIPLNTKLSDVYIPKKYTSNALNGDTVLIKILPHSRGQSVEGKVIEIVKRSAENIIGIVKKERNKFSLIPDDSSLTSPIIIEESKLNGAMPQHKVLCDIIKIDKKGNVFVKVSQILGHKNDPGIDILSIVYKHGFSPIFPQSVMDEMNSISDTVSESDLNNRVDLRDKLIVTIDGDDAKDLDDAVSLEKLYNGNYLLGVHIADVSHYVTENSEVDKEAFNRSTSVYLVDRVVPMLPHYLSNGICSLNSHVDRLTMSCDMEITPAGKVVNHSIYPSVIHSSGRLTYNKVNELFAKNNDAVNKEYAQYSDMLFEMNKVAHLLRVKRDERGSINFETDEAKILVDEVGKPYDIVLRVRGEAEKLIEEFMLLANETVAEHFHWLNVPFIYRIHENPNIEKLEKLVNLVGTMGYKIHLKNKSVHPNTLKDLLNTVNGKKEERVINTMLLRTMAKAKYSEENLGHYGLSSKYYTHFTSPIRRYPDTIVHRLIREYLVDKKVSANNLKRLHALMPEIATQTSKRERNAISAEREVNDMKMAEYMLSHLGEKFSGIISSVTSWGFYVELPNTIEGLVHATNLKDDFYDFDEKLMILIGRKTKKIFRIGDEVDVIVKSADKKLGEIDFVLAE